MRKRDKNLPLTETTYYILLALIEPGHGYIVMQKIEELSGGQVRIAAGTMYGAIETLFNKGWIVEVRSSDLRRKVYKTTDAGRKYLLADYKRMEHMLSMTSDILGKGVVENDKI
jgi:DNA-binding PadR family transcriptional regulator